MEAKATFAHVVMTILVGAIYWGAFIKVVALSISSNPHILSRERASLDKMIGSWRRRPIFIYLTSTVIKYNRNRL